MKYGVIGEHLKHSFSKEIHALISDYEYEICEIEPDKIGDFLIKADFCAINVTIPYKEKVIPYLHHVSDVAKRIGAVNTVVNKNGQLYGYNTDYMGMRALILKNKIDVNGKKALILGTGATSKTAYAVLEDLGAREIVRVGRDISKADTTYELLEREHGDAEFILNTTPVGMYPKNGEKIISLQSFPSVMGVIDVVYNPLRTGLVLDALDMGIKAEGGLYMLSSQAVYASELFTDSVLGENVSKRVFNGVLNEKENIVLVGMPSSGKTTVGRYLAGLTERKFVDTDEEIVKKIGMDIKTYFKEYGEEAFRDVESEVIKEVSKEGGLIIATGGGAILRSQNVRDLKQNGRIYFINRSLEMLTPTDDRPLSSDFSELEKRYKERYPIYCSVADVTVPSNGAVKQIAEIIKGEFYR